jgi:hypothetical protein
MEKGVGCMKIGGAYMSFYGMTTIEKSILSNRKILDYICVVHQTKGIFCDEDDGGLLLVLQDMKRKNVIDDLVVCNNDMNETIESYVTNKRNVGLNLCVGAGCDYIVPLDADEIYTKDLCDEIKQNPNIDTFYSPIRTYYVEPIKCFDEDYYVPSAYKIDGRIFKQKYDNSYRVDPLRCMDEKIYMKTSAKMHHYSLTKETILDKLKHNIGKIDPSNNLKWEMMLDYIERRYNGKQAYVMTTHGILEYIGLEVDMNSPWK